MFDWWLTIAFLLFFVGSWVFTSLAEKKRLKGLASTAAENDLELLSSPPSSDLDKFLRFPFANQTGTGSPGRAFVMDNGQTRVTLFDYEISTGDGKGRKVTHYSLGLVTDARMKMPATRVARSTIANRIFELVGRKAIQIENDPNFNQDFRVSGLSEQDCLDFLVSDRRDAIRQGQILSIEILGNTFLVEFSQKRLSGADFRPYLATCLSLGKAMREKAS